VAAAAVALAIPALTVVWLGWLLLRSDQELDRQRVQERLDAAAGLVVGALDRALTMVDQRLVTVGGASGSARQDAASAFRLDPADGTVVVFGGEEAWSSRPLPWYPGDAVMPDDAAAFDFIDAEGLEFRDDLAGAAAAYHGLSRSADPGVRAGAMARLARVARKRGQEATALAAYDALASMTDVTALGRPADLLARFERLALLQSTTASPGAGRDGSPSRPSAESRALDEALLAGRWHLARSQFDFYRSRIVGRAGSPSRPSPPATISHPLVIAEAVSSTAEAVAAAAPTTPGARVAWSNAHGRGIAVWRRVGDRVAALVTTQAWLERTWLADVRAIARGQRAHVSLTTADGTEWLDGALAGPTLRRSAADTGLPVTIRVASADLAGDTSRFGGRRRLLAGIVAALALLMVGAGYVAARGLAREVAAARLQSDFVAAVSHEFRTPVASVRQLSELLEDGRVADEGKRREYYARIRRQAGRLQRLVENLLDFGRMEADAAEYRMERLDTADLVRDVTQEFEGEGRGSGRMVDVVMHEPLPSIVGDREALGRALWNLLDNAAKYAPASAPIRVEAAVEDGGVTIRVRDEGPGIPLDEQSRIFDKFVRGGHARESGAKGTGLGLAMVRHIVRAHGGEVSVESEPGRGSTFTISIQAMKDASRE
jgi:signal transduction histidine kinase